MKFKVKTYEQVLTRNGQTYAFNTEPIIINNQIVGYNHLKYIYEQDHFKLKKVKKEWLKTPISL